MVKDGFKQKTLFQSWGPQKGDENVAKVPVAEAGPSTSRTHDDRVIDLCESFDEDDDVLLANAEESLSFNKSENESTPRKSVNGTKEDNACNISIGAGGFTPTQRQTQGHDLPGFDSCAGKKWIFPTNYPVRDYQFNVVQQALFKNTMVTLPTGLGKTFIGAVVMYNFYRWYPQGKIVFMAPTKPLVAQQIEACYNIMGIPQDHTAEMTGTRFFCDF